LSYYFIVSLCVSYNDPCSQWISALQRTIHPNDVKHFPHRFVVLLILICSRPVSLPHLFARPLVIHKPFLLIAASAPHCARKYRDAKPDPTNSCPTEVTGLPDRFYSNPRFPQYGERSLAGLESYSPRYRLPVPGAGCVLRVSPAARGRFPRPQASQACRLWAFGVFAPRLRCLLADVRSELLGSRAFGAPTSGLPVLAVARSRFRRPAGCSALSQLAWGHVPRHAVSSTRGIAAAASCLRCRRLCLRSSRFSGLSSPSAGLARV
jgi:hypothetical protein